MTICSKYPKELIHYNAQLKKTCLRKLKDNVWESKTKWQLMHKAQGSYDYKLIRRTFCAWLTFTDYKLRKKKKIETANMYFSIKTKRKAFSALKSKVEPRRILIKKLDVVRNFKLMKISWKYWKKYVRKSLRWKEVDFLTKKMREFYLLRTVIELWFVSCSVKNVTEMKNLRATAHRNLVLKRNFFIAWRHYLRWKLCKKKLISQFLAQVEVKVKERFFFRLKQYTQHKKLYEKHVQCVTTFYETYLVRNVLDKWNMKYEDLMVLRNREKYNISVKFYEASLLEKFYKKLKTWSIVEKSRNDTADLFINIKIKLYLDLWRKSHRESLLSNSLEEKAQKWRNDQLKLIYLTKMFELFEDKRKEIRKIENFIKVCENRMKSESFRKWLHFSFVKTEKKAKLYSAQRHYNNKITRMAFRLLNTYATRRISKIIIFRYYHYRVLSKSFKTLKSYSRVKKIRRDFIYEVQERYKVRVLRRAFSVMNEETKSNRNKLIAAREIANNKIRRKTFQRLKKFYEMRKQENMVIHDIQFILQSIIIRDVITQWWRKVQVNIWFKEKLIKVKSNQEKRFIRNYLKKWISVIDKFKLLREKCEVFGEVHAEIVLQYSLVKIIEVWNGRRLVKEKEEFALRAEKEFLVKRYFKRWITFVAWKKEKLRECSARIFHAEHLDEKLIGYSNVRLKRKQPMIPLYLREELLYLQGSTSSLEFSSNDTHDFSSPVIENLPMIY